jgi:hypothetical protein
MSAHYYQRIIDVIVPQSGGVRDFSRSHGVFLVIRQHRKDFVCSVRSVYYAAHAVKVVLLAEKGYA